MHEAAIAQPLTRCRVRGDESGGAITLRQRLVARIGLRIVSGELPAGQLLQLEQLANDEDVSLPVVRESMSVLASVGLVESRRRRGTVVLPHSYWNHLSPLIIGWKLEDPAQRDAQFEWLIQLRTALEPAAAALAAQHRTPDQAADLTDLGNELVAAARVSDLDTFLDADVRFHELVFAASCNPLLSGMAHQMDVVLTVRHHFDLMPTKPDQQAVGFHVELARAVVEQRGDDARAMSLLIVDQAAQEFLAAARRAL